MPITGKVYSFTKENVYKAPDLAGVYALFDGDKCIYIGVAEGGKSTLRARLKEDFAGQSGANIKKATDYMRETCVNFADREKELLSEYELDQGKLPKCNGPVAT